LTPLSRQTYAVAVKLFARPTALIGAILALAIGAMAGFLLRGAFRPSASREPVAKQEKELTTPPSSADAPPGKWRKANETLRTLTACPYLQGYEPAHKQTGIIRFDSEKASAGWNLCTSGHAAEAILMDIEGRVRHTWRYPLTQVWPDLAADPRMRKLEYWRHARLLPGGRLLAIYEGMGVICLDRDSRLLWAWRGGAHHDLDITPEGDILVLDREPKLLPRINPDEGVLEDFVTHLDSQGRAKKKTSVLEAFERSSYAPLLCRMPRKGDILHTNAIEILDGTQASIHTAFRRGNILLSVLELDAVAVLDPDRGEIVWALSGLWRKQHHPTLLPNGRLLVFDNLGAGDQSRLLELNPLTQEIVWKYGGRPETDFFSKTLGSCQRLPNGNTLITESENGRAFEVTSEGEVVWEYRSPHRAGEKGELVAALFEVSRLAPTEIRKLLGPDNDLSESDSPSVR